MNLEDIRPSFSVYVISARVDELAGAIEALNLVGYSVSTFGDLDAAFASVATNPPHVIAIHHEGDIDALTQTIDRVYAHLPETHVIVATAWDRRPEVTPLLDRGIYDVVYLPLAHALEMQRAIDRAVERDYFMYQNERLNSVPEPSNVIRLSSDDGAFAARIFNERTVDGAIQIFLNAAGTPGLFFRYLAHRRTLVATLSEGLDPSLINGVGLDLNQEVVGFRTEQLRTPSRLPAFCAMIEDVLGTKTFAVRVLETAGEVNGVLVFPNERKLAAKFDERLLLLDRAVGLIETQKRLHVVNTRDDATEVLSKVNFTERVVHEVSRARRVNLPVALLAVAFDQYDLIGGEIGTSEAQLMLKTVAKLCEKYSRVNDVIGRIGTSELGVLLPHTSRRGALIKAERLRRALAQADFGKVVRSHARVTVSIGVSEYPTLVRDADELLSSADETLFHIRKQGNRTAVAEAPTHFTPDFHVQDLK